MRVLSPWDPLLYYSKGISSGWKVSSTKDSRFPSFFSLPHCHSPMLNTATRVQANVTMSTVTVRLDHQVVTSAVYKVTKKHSDKCEWTVRVKLSGLDGYLSIVRRLSSLILTSSGYKFMSRPPSFWTRVIKNRPIENIIKKVLNTPLIAIISKLTG